MICSGIVDKDKVRIKIICNIYEYEISYPIFVVYVVTPIRDSRRPKRSNLDRTNIVLTNKYLICWNSYDELQEERMGAEPEIQAERSAWFGWLLIFSCITVLGHWVLGFQVSDFIPKFVSCW